MPASTRCRRWPPEHSHEIAGAVPQARLALLPGAGHMLTMEQPEAVATLLADWLHDTAAV